MKKFDKIEEIEQYLEGNLEEKDLKVFEERMAKDVVFASEVELFMDMKTTIHRYEEKKIKNSIHNVHNQLSEEKFFQRSEKRETKGKSNLRRILNLAAGVALIIAAAFFLFQPNNTPNAAEIFAASYQPETTKIIGIMDDLGDYGLVDPDAERKDNLIQALNFYQKGQYGEASTNLGDFLTQYPNDKIAQFYLGMSELHESKFETAIKNLQPLTKDKSFELFDESRWNLALSQLMLESEGGNTATVQLFKEIAADANSAFQTKAKKNLERYE